MASSRDSDLEKQLRQLIMIVGAAATIAATARDASAQGAPRVERIAVIGCADCGGAAQFAEVADIAVTPSGVVWVADREAPHIRAFRSTGAVLRTFGRTGRGPGEFTGISKLLPATDGTLNVVEMNTQRVTHVDSLGKYIASTSIGGFPEDAGAPSGASSVHILHSQFRPGTSVVSRLDPKTSSPQTVIGPLADFPRPDAPAQPHSLAVAPDGTLAVADGHDDYRIRVFAPGRAPRDITRTVPRKQRTPAEMATMRARLARSGERLASEATTSGGRAARGGPDAPTEKSYLPWLALQYDPRGRLWVLTMRGDETKTIFDVFDSTLAYLGEVTVAGEVSRFSLGGEFLATAAPNGDGVPQVTVWRVLAR
jgi:hypothetical protein